MSPVDDQGVEAFIATVISDIDGEISSREIHNKSVICGGTAIDDQVRKSLLGEEIGMER